MDLFWIFWIAVLVLCIIMEAATSELVAIWFFPAAVVAMILSFCKAPLWVQFVIFLAIGLVLLFSTRPICRKFLKNKNSKTNTDLLLGEKCLVTEEICNREERGEVKINGLRWSARSQDPDEIIKVGTVVTALEIQGVKLIVKP